MRTPKAFLIKALAVGLFLAAALEGAAQEINPASSIIPRPLHLVPGRGSFPVTGNTAIVLKGQTPELKTIGGQLQERIRYFTGYDLKVVELSRGAAPKKAITLTLASLPDSLGEEGYRILVAPDRIELAARRPQGLFYAVQSLLQLLPSQKPGEGVALTVPAVRITDRPAYAWRGMHLDVGRHFFPVEFIKRTLDNLALHKINTFHWHLTEDQGWRIEIKKYPRLTEVGAWRSGTLVGHTWDKPARFDGERYGGYYTQDQIREVVAYARKRHINIVPEIDVPGHSLAALAAYPELSCTGGPFAVSQTWGVFEDVYCAGREETFRFLEDVFSEVAGLFPGPIIHIGGDEAPKTRWKACARCQTRIKAEGLKDEHELQSYFIKRIQQVLHKKGKKIIGWDEILEGGLAPGAMVMSWRGIKGGIAAAKQKHEVIMTPNTALYLDHYQGQPLEEPLAYRGTNTLRKVYDFDPRPDALSEEEARYIKGVQANLWTEYIKTPRHAEYMLFPRLAALAETAWTDPQHKDWESFSRRLEALYQRYAALHINFARSAYQVQPQVQYSADAQAMEVQLRHDASDAPIYYTLDGSQPGEQSLRYTAPLQLTGPVLLKAAAFAGGQRRALLERTIVPNKATGRKVRLIGAADHRSMSEAAALVNGIKGLPSSRDRAEWTGFYAKEMVAVLDLDTPQRISRLSASFLQEACKNIALPDSVEYAVSGDGKTFTPVGVVARARAAGSDVVVQEFPLTLAPQAVRYVRVRTHSAGPVPSGDEPAEKKWIYADEIQVE